MLRAAVLCALIAFPLAGCLDDGSASTYVQLFDYEPIERGGPALSAQDCSDLLADLDHRLEVQATISLERNIETGEGLWQFAGRFVSQGGSELASGTVPPPRSARDAAVTGTNNQEHEVDEADILKTDGEWTYVAAGNILRILRSEAVGDLRDTAQIDLGSVRNVRLLLETRDPYDPADDRLLVISYGSIWDTLETYPGTEDLVRSAGLMTHIQVFQVANRSAPWVTKEIWIQGDEVGARLVDGVAHIIVHRQDQALGMTGWTFPSEEDLDVFGMDRGEYWQASPDVQTEVQEVAARRALKENQAILANLTLRDHLPLIVEPHGGRLIAEPVTESTCERVLSTSGGTGRGVSTILSMDLDDSWLSSSTLQVVGGTPLVYGAQDALVLAESSQDSWWTWTRSDMEETMDLHWFDLDGVHVTPRASGRVAGTIQDSFGIDVQDDRLRVVTTIGDWGRWWVADPGPGSTHVVIFEEAEGRLEEVGRVGGIAPNERLFSVRFTDDRAYIVTFRQQDPLWIVDLTGRGAPRILGELEVPGVSTYIHPLGDDLLLTVGFGPRSPGGTGLDRNRIQVSLFDTSDPMAPMLADVEVVSPQDGWSQSGATDDHKAFTYWPAIGELAVPLHTSRSVEIGDGEDKTKEWQMHVGLVLVHVDEARKRLERTGELDHDGFLGEETGYGSWSTPKIQRSYFLGYPQADRVSIYAMSPLAMTAHDLDGLGLQSAVPFDPVNGWY